MRGWRYLAAFMALLVPSILAVTSAWADPPRAANYSPSVGTLAAMALETMGYTAQEMVLADLDQLLGRLAALIWVGCAFSGIVTLALGGQYRTALWFFIGPALFSFLLEKGNYAPPEWQFGKYPLQKKGEAEQRVEDSLSQVTLDSEKSSSSGSYQKKQRNVSTFFHRYNLLVSSAVRGIIDTLLDDNAKAQINFLTRQKLITNFFEFDAGDPGVYSLIRENFGQCYESMNAARVIALGARDEAYQNSQEYKDAHALFCKLYQTPTARLEGPALQEAKSVLETTAHLDKVSRQVNLSALYGDNGQGEFATCMNKLRGKTQSGQTLTNSTALTCEELWCLTGESLVLNVITYADASIRQNVPKDAPAAIVKEMLDDIVVKLTKVNNGRGTGNIQKANREALETHQMQTNVDCSGQGGGTSTDSRSATRLSLIPVIIGGHIIRKQLQQEQRHQVIAPFFERGGAGIKPYNANFSEEASAYRSAEERQDMNRKIQNMHQGESRKFEAYHLAMMLPYIQGVILYLLAMTFPFFALIVVVPGKAGSFFAWCALWLWVKLWDVGYAIVMVIDNILWELMPHSGVYSPIADPNHGPITVFDAAFSGDPSYSLNNYYMMIGMMLNAVPIISAQFVLGGKRALGGVFLGGARTMSQYSGTAAADWVATADQALPLEALREQLRQDYIDQHMNDPIDGDKGKESAFTEQQAAVLQRQGAQETATRNLASRLQTAAPLAGAGAFAVGLARVRAAESGDTDALEDQRRAGETWLQRMGRAPEAATKEAAIAAGKIGLPYLKAEEAYSRLNMAAVGLRRKATEIRAGTNAMKVGMLRYNFTGESRPNHLRPETIAPTPENRARIAALKEGTTVFRDIDSLRAGASGRIEFTLVEDPRNMMDYMRDANMLEGNTAMELSRVRNDALWVAKDSVRAIPGLQWLPKWLSD